MMYKTMGQKSQGFQSNFLKNKQIKHKQITEDIIAINCALSYCFRIFWKLLSF